MININKIQLKSLSLFILLTFSSFVFSSNNVNDIEESQILTCIVNDKDINTSYRGECKNGYAHGLGEARGRDIYVGVFYEGEPHKYGTYRWGPDSEWSGDVYEGEWLHGARTGKGTYTFITGIIQTGDFVRGRLDGFAVEKYPRSRTIGMNFHPEGYWDNNFWILKGYWKDHDFTFACESMDDCLEKWEKLQQEKQLLEDINIEKKDDPIELQSNNILDVCEWVKDTAGQVYSARQEGWNSSELIDFQGNTPSKELNKIAGIIIADSFNEQLLNNLNEKMEATHTFENKWHMICLNWFM